MQIRCVLVDQAHNLKGKEAKFMLLHDKETTHISKTTTNKSFVPCIQDLHKDIIQNRNKRKLDENQPREQAGFGEGFCTTDHLHALNQLII